MLIIQLPPNLRDLAILRTRELSRENRLLSDEQILNKGLGAAFIWSDSPEGHYFWEKTSIPWSPLKYEIC